MGTNSERGTIPDGIVGPHTDPVRDGPVLPHLLRQFLLDYECLVWRLQTTKSTIRNQVNKTLTSLKKLWFANTIFDSCLRECSTAAPRMLLLNPNLISESFIAPLFFYFVGFYGLGPITRLFFCFSFTIKIISLIPPLNYIPTTNFFRNKFKIFYPFCL